MKGKNFKMDCFENRLQVNKLIVQEFYKLIAHIDEDIEFYTNYPFKNSKCKIEILERTKNTIENTIEIYKTTGKFR